MAATPEPESNETEPAIVPLPDARTLALVVLAGLALIYTLHVAKAFFLPVVLAVMLDFLLSPIIRLLARLHIPEAIGALIVMLVLVGGLSLAVWNLADPVQAWVTRAPQSLSDVRSKIRKVTKRVQDVGKAAEQVESATQAAAGSTSQQQQVVVRGPSLAQRLFGTTQGLLIGLFEVIILLYFLLAAGDLFLQKLVRVVPEFTDKKKAVHIVREAEFLGIGVSGDGDTREPGPGCRDRAGDVAGRFAEPATLGRGGRPARVCSLPRCGHHDGDADYRGPRHLRRPRSRVPGAGSLCGDQSHSGQPDLTHHPGPSPHPEPGRHFRGTVVLDHGVGRRRRIPGRATSRDAQDFL
jgi:hypothetical protein